MINPISSNPNIISSLSIPLLYHFEPLSQFKNTMIIIRLVLSYK